MHLIEGETYIMSDIKWRCMVFHFISSKLKSLRAAKQWEKQGIERIGRKGEMANKDMTGRRQDTSEVRYSSRTLGLVGGSKRHEQWFIKMDHAQYNHGQEPASKIGEGPLAANGVEK